MARAGAGTGQWIAMVGQLKLFWAWGPRFAGAVIAGQLEYLDSFHQYCQVWVWGTSTVALAGVFDPWKEFQQFLHLAEPLELVNGFPSFVV